MGRPRIYKDAKTSYKAKLRWIDKHNKETYKAITIRLYLKEDKELIDFVAKQPEKTVFFRKVIREYLENHKGE